ncbi:acetoacetate decarboxylase family protein [Nonomuraea cavernae]|uniref:acetoacetate decarboxylase family protein n=1 Tax=Nonomuraea cavernae TaxID=2045107 RepID=UPI0033F7CF02
MSFVSTGFTRPFSPDGTASVLPEPPYDFAIQATMVHFRTDPEALAQLVPPPLKPLQARAGEAFWLVIDHMMSPVNVSGADWHPERRRMLEATIGIPVELDGAPGVYYSHSWTDREWSFLMEALTGINGKLARIAITEGQRMHPVWSGPRAGAVFDSTVERLGTRVAGSRVTLEERITPAESPTAELFNIFMLRHVPNFEIAAAGRPLAYDLVTERDENVVFGDVWRGTGELTFHDAENEWLTPIAPVETIAGYHLEVSFRLMGIEVVKDLLPDWDAAQASQAQQARP